jgi:hypothetical protein
LTVTASIRRLRSQTDCRHGQRGCGSGYRLAIRRKRSYVSTLIRFLGIKILAIFLSHICKSRITDPTSGFWMVNRKLLYYFAHDYPTEYPEPEAIALLRRYGFSFKEEPVNFRPRRAGRSSIGAWGTVYYMMKVGLALLVDRIRPIDPRFRKDNLGHIS